MRAATGKARGVSAAQMRKIALSFPEALEKPSYGKPSFFIAKKFFTRWRNEDNSIVLIVDSMDTRDMMLELDPRTYFITDHYRDYPGVLVRAGRVTPDELKAMLERRFRQIAPKKLLKAMDADGARAPENNSRSRGAARKTGKKRR